MLNKKLFVIGHHSKLIEVLACEINEELEKDILEFLNGEVAVEEKDLFNYFQELSIEDILLWLEEYEEKWNPSSRIFTIVLEELQFNGQIFRENTLKSKRETLNIYSNEGINYSVIAFDIAVLKRGGIYQIRNMLNNKIYVGSAKNFKKRWREHRNGLNGRYHGNQYLQNSWNLYKDANFNFEIIEYIDDTDSLFLREKYWLERLNVTDDKNGYNIYPCPIGFMTGQYPEETRMKISKGVSGENNGRAILNNQKAWEIKMLINKTDLNVGEIAHYYNINTTIVADIKRGVRWKNVKFNKEQPLPKKLIDIYREISLNSTPQKLSRNQVKEIKMLIRDTTLTNVDIAEMYNTGTTAISNIRTGESWSSVKISHADILPRHLLKLVNDFTPKRKKPVFLDNESVKEVKLLLKEGRLKYHQIGEIFNISESVVSNIKNNVYYEEAQVEEGDKLSINTRNKANSFVVIKHRNNSKATINQVKQIKKLLKEINLSQAEIGKIVGVPRHTVNNIKCGKIWVDISEE